MHILIVNDDGPPSPHSSPYVHSLVRALQAHNHTVSVCLPHTQRSWIGKAHMIGQTVKPVYYRPPGPQFPPAGLSSPSDEGTPSTPQGTTHARPSTKPGTEEWILVDGTPASCVQIGLYHYFEEKGPVDLVLSGPNYGRNTTAVFALSSGTLGGALEAAVCGRRAVALSYAFFTRNHDPDIVAAASRQSVRVLEALVKQWPTDGSVDLYSVNVPLVEGLEGKKVMWTPVLQNYWGRESCFTEMEGSVDGEDEEEERIREGEEGGEAVEGGGRGETNGTGHVHRHRHFKWAPKLADVLKAVESSPPGNDGWAVSQGITSVTPLRANFAQAAETLHGKELELQDLPETVKKPHVDRVTMDQESVRQLAIRGKRDAVERQTPPSQNNNHIYALLNYEDDYVQPLILSAMTSIFLPASFMLLDTPASLSISLTDILPSPSSKLLQIAQYESIDFEYASSHPHTCLINSYMIRKALIRKHFLSATVDAWVAKHPDSVLKTHVKRAEAFELDYAEFLDDALVEAFELRASLEANEGKEAEKREWWILKPGMSERGQGIRLFSSMEDLQGIFDAWEEDMPDSGEEDEEDVDGEDKGGDGIMTSHLRHFVAQPYIDPPLLLPQLDNRKFHVRVYVLAVGSLKVYVYKHMLALFAGKPYQPPWAAEEGDIDLDAHLTNTCLQGPGARSDSVMRFWDLPLASGGSVTREGIYDQILAVTGDIFEAAARTMMVHFQPLQNAFEVFGVDFLVDAGGAAWLLEINAFPDFKQTGDEAGLRDIVAGFWNGVMGIAVGEFMDGEARQEEDMVLVRDVDLGRR